MIRSPAPVRFGGEVRLLALGRGAVDSPPWSPLPLNLLTTDVAVGTEHADNKHPGVMQVTRTRPIVRRGGARFVAAWIKTRWVAERYGAPADWLWTLKGSRWLRRELTRRDVVVSLDSDTDRALAAAPDVLRSVPWLSSAVFTQGRLQLNALDDLLAHILETAARGQMSQDDLDLHVRRWAIRMQTIDLESLGPLQPVEAVAQTARGVLGFWGPHYAACVVIEVLDDPRWDGERRARTGLMAHRAMADLWSSSTEAAPSRESLSDAVGVTLASAQEALHRGRSEQSLDLHTDAMALLFHRERHAEVVGSTLVDDPGEYLRDLWASSVHQKLATGHGGVSVARAQSSERGRPRVLVLTGAYGEFHHPVATALAPIAEVREFRAVPRGNRTWHRFTTPGLLASVARLGANGKNPWPGLSPADEAEGAVVNRLQKALNETDVLFTDWADRSSVLASHLLPDGVRMVLRVHSLDALDPWFHLLRWAAVDQVVVTSEPLRSLVCELLLAAGVRTSVTVLPNLVPLSAYDRPKHADARCTLGLVGWGRRVKDPLWALDLLARDPSWRLRLIGPDFDTPSSAPTADYVAEVRSRLTDPSLKDRVEIVGRTDDVASELAHVGVILSSSRRENFHLGLVEGASSGSIPVVRDWPLWASRGGARSLFPADWIVADIDEAETRVRAMTLPEAWREQSHLTRTRARELFDPTQAARGYREAILPGQAVV